MCDGEVRAVPLHRRPDLLAACADLLNAEWRRSAGARRHSLEQSCDGFPVSLVLLQGAGAAERLLGHARLSLVVGQEGSLFVESVVVAAELRGRGFGRALMEAAERYARGRGFRRLCLTTHDQQCFYARLGYGPSRPVQSAGAMTAFVPMEVLQRFSRPPAEGGDSRMAAAAVAAPLPRNGPHCLSVTTPSQAPPLDTPTALLLAPPLPSLSSSGPPKASLCHPATPAPPPPPLSAHLQPAVSSSSPQAALGTPYRDARGRPVFWMQKDL
nr:PREDICTED: N-acetyltransferase 6 [Lepisosteus oculatus]